jgi:hypothetical protein
MRNACTSLHRIRLSSAHLAEIAGVILSRDGSSNPYLLIGEISSVVSVEHKLVSELSRLDVYSRVAEWLFENIHPENKSRLFSLESDKVVWK